MRDRTKKRNINIFLDPVIVEDMITPYTVSFEDVGRYNLRGHDPLLPFRTEPGRQTKVRMFIIGNSYRADSQQG